MVSVRGGASAVGGFLVLLGLASSAWAHAPDSPNSASTPKAKVREDLSCAAAVTDQRRLRHSQKPAVIHCAPPPTSHEGYRLIAWTLDPDEPTPEASSRSIVVAVHERACTGGRNPIPHLQRPEVRYLKRTVVITLWIDELEGPHTCPGNPIGHLRVKLPGPLGARQLYDGSSDPPRKVEPGEDPNRLPRQ